MIIIKKIIKYRSCAWLCFFFVLVYLYSIFLHASPCHHTCSGITSYLCTCI
jgi:hypothetical protein